MAKSDYWMSNSERSHIASEALDKSLLEVESTCKSLGSGGDTSEREIRLVMLRSQHAIMLSVRSLKSDIGNVKSRTHACNDM